MKMWRKDDMSTKQIDLRGDADKARQLLDTLFRDEEAFIPGNRNNCFVDLAILTTVILKADNPDEPIDAYVIEDAATEYIKRVEDFDHRIEGYDADGLGSWRNKLYSCSVWAHDRITSPNFNGNWQGLLLTSQ
jgi:hypothetical protein